MRGLSLRSERPTLKSHTSLGSSWASPALASQHHMGLTSRLAVSLMGELASESRVLMIAQPGSERVSLCSKGTALSSTQLCPVNTYRAVQAPVCVHRRLVNAPDGWKTEARQGAPTRGLGGATGSGESPRCPVLLHPRPAAVAALTTCAGWSCLGPQQSSEA